MAFDPFRLDVDRLEWAQHDLEASALFAVAGANKPAQQTYATLDEPLTASTRAAEGRVATAETSFAYVRRLCPGGDLDARGPGEPRPLRHRGGR